MRRIREKQVEMVVSPSVMTEYARVLGYPHLRPRHGLDDAAIAAAVDELEDFAVVVEPAERLAVVRDESDNQFLECAVAGSVDLMLSGDRHLLDIGTHHGIRIITPAAFVAYLDAVSTESP